MRAELMRKCKRMHYRRFTNEQIALVLNVTVPDVELALCDQRKQERPVCEIGPDALIDGERLEDRVRRLKGEIRSGRLVIPRADR
ncbi:MAG: hypothetical protein E6R03_05380 [Hyphomicrobiaceae bacterium]|nr:MAG: hypothetical protein E6R03_05380 [Hyphomicrobiaceae bacterium]